MAATTWVGDSPSCAACWTSPAIRNSAVRLTRASRKTFTSSVKIIRFRTLPATMTVFPRDASKRRRSLPHQPGGPLPHPLQDRLGRLGHRRDRLGPVLQVPVLPGQLDLHEEVAAQERAEVADRGVVQVREDLGPEGVELELHVPAAGVQLPGPADADGLADQVELVNLHPVAAESELGVGLLE